MNNPSRPQYLDHLSKSSLALYSNDGRQIEVLELNSSVDQSSLKTWAAAFRQAYCLDEDLDRFLQGTGKSRKDYLIDLVFPSATVGFGPATRAGDFTELLLSDYLEHLLGFWVPRHKYMYKANPNESVQGVDVVGFSNVKLGVGSPTDIMIVCEVKAGLAKKHYDNQLQKAIDDSSKDYLRAGYTLNAMKRRLLASGDNASAVVVERFQNITDRPYVFRSTAAAVLSNSAFNESALAAVNTTDHNNTKNLDLLVVKGAQLMTLVHALYEEAAHGA